MTLSRVAALSTFTATLLTLSGCFIFNGNGDDDPETDDEVIDGEGTDDRSDESAPRFLDFSVNTTVANEVDQITFTAVLTDPDGIDDLIGGTLKSPSGASYGAFQTSSSEGAYELDVDWADLNTVDIIDLNVTSERVFVGEFFDAAGNTASRELTLTLECEDDGSSTCGGDGLCDPLDTVDNCGACGHDCNDDLPTVPDPDNTFYSDRPSCDDSDNMCWLAYEIRNAVGVTCNEVCGDWNCFSAASGGFISGTVPVECNEPVTGTMTCTCDRAP